MKTLAEIDISHTQVARLTHEIGNSLIEQRDRDAERHRYRELPVAPHQTPVQVACVEVDGGRIMTRAADQARGVHEKQWKEPKVGVLWRMSGETFPEDPHPQLPRCFQDREAVPKLVRDIHGGSTSTAEDSEHGICLQERSETPAEMDDPQGRQRWQPKRIFRTCVATLRDVHGFGPLVAAEAQTRGFYQAQRKAFVGDGQDSNWTVHRLHFPDFTPITDFMHAVAYTYTAAQVTAAPDEGWQRYLQYATACWQARTHEVIAELQGWLDEHPLPEGIPLKQIPDGDPRKVVYESLTYLRNNCKRMNYPTYRRQGLPVTSSLVESLIKELNWRVKGTEKYWNRPEEPATSRRTGRPLGGSTPDRPDMSAESILQVRAALLCDDNRLGNFIHSRPGSPFVRRTSRRDPSAPNHAA